MENLWKKESNRISAQYVDCFKNIDADYVKKISTWLNRHNKQTKSRKNNAILVNSQNRLLRKRKVIAQNEKIIKKQHTIVTKHGRNSRKNLKRNVIEEFQAKLSFPEHEHFSGIANVLEIKEYEQYGRHFIANCNIDIGKVIAVGAPFAEVVISPSTTKNLYCNKCKKCATNFISCNNCDDVKFCSEECRSSDGVHQLECNSIYHQIKCFDVKLAVHMVLIAIQNYSTAQNFIQHFETLISHSPICQNGIMLRLNRSSCDDNILLGYEAYNCLMAMPNIQDFFKTKRQQRFLMHLVLHYAAIIPSNAWTTQLNDDKEFEMKYIHDFMSFFNHSCAPNAFYSIIGNYGYCLTVRPIQKGEQVFINYLGDQVEGTKADRQRILKDEWNIDCVCERCTPTPNTYKIDHRLLFNDSAFQYISKHQGCHENACDNDCDRRKLRQNCITFIQKFGRFWTQTLDCVIKEFVLVTTCNQN